jgi:hypothetical protein
LPRARGSMHFNCGLRSASRAPRVPPPLPFKPLLRACEAIRSPTRFRSNAPSVYTFC